MAENRTQLKHWNLTLLPSSVFCKFPFLSIQQKIKAKLSINGFETENYVATEKNAMKISVINLKCLFEFPFVFLSIFNKEKFK